MKNARYILRLTTAFLIRFRLILLLSVLFGIGIFFVLNAGVFRLESDRARRVGITGRYTTDKLPSEILHMVGSGLTRIDEKGDVAPDLASSWETPDKGKTWVFYLKDGLFWQDKEKVHSSDINYQFSDLTMEKPDEKTIVFKLEDAYSAFPSVVSRPVFKKGLLGTGKWQVKKVVVSGGFVSQIILEAKGEGRLVYKFFPTEERLKLAFKLGEVDEIRGVFNPTPLNEWKGVKVEENINIGEFVAIFFNTQDASLSDKTTRQLLAYAIDKNALGGKRALGPISESSWAFNPQVKPYEFDSQKAKEELTEGMQLTLTTSPLLLPTAEKVAKNWEGVGVKVNIQVLPSVPENYQALLAIFDIPEDPDQYSIWHTTQTSTNITRYSSPRIDKLLEDGRTEINLEERKKIYLDFQRFLVEDSPAHFLYYPKTYTIRRS